jgi:EmrB/QacA subfamily drug resistance transporter
MTETRTATAAGTGLILLTLSAGQFLMTLDSSVMNVSMATVANDLGTTITGIQTAITMYTLVMATMMITGGKIGTKIGRKRAFTIGCVIYGTGSAVTGLAPNLAVLLLGWSLLEGLGAALIMPAIVGLVASNFATKERPRAYGLVAAAGAVAVAVGPLIGGAATTYFSWRWVFFGEVFVVIAILILARRVHEEPVTQSAPLDFVGTVLSALGLGLAVFGVLRSSEWGWIQANDGAPELFGISATFWLIICGGLVLWTFFWWERRMLDHSREPLVDPGLFRNRVLDAGLIMFGFQFLLQAGIFFIVPLYLSVVLELSAIDTGLRILPLSVALLATALGVPRVFPAASPRRVIRVGILLMLAGILVLMSGVDLSSDAAVVAVPMLLIGAGIGCLASQLGAVTVSSVPEERSGEIGGLQNTATNLGASLGTALAGSVMIAALTSTFLVGLQADPDASEQVKSQATVQLAAGAPFISDSQLESALSEAGITGNDADAVAEQNTAARVAGLDAALGILAMLAMVSLFLTGSIPTRPVGSEEPQVADATSG